MSTLQSVRQGLGRTWETLAEGWHRLRETAGQALTRFMPLHKGGELERWEDQFIARSPGWGLLAVEVHEDDEQLNVRLEVPGMDKDHFDIDVVDNVLVVRGEKRVQQEQRKGRMHIMECAYGAFERAIPLPVDVEGDRATATYRHGVLRVSLPKRHVARARRIPVNAV